MVKIPEEENRESKGLFAGTATKFPFLEITGFPVPIPEVFVMVKIFLFSVF